MEISGVEGATVIGPSGGDGALVVRSHEVTICDLVIEGGIGVKIERGGAAKVINNMIQPTGTAIFVDDNSYGRILFNEVRGNGSWTGMYIWDSSYADIKDNTVNRERSDLIFMGFVSVD